MRSKWVVAVVVMWMCVVSGGVMAGDWPQLLGPERNGIAQDEKIVDSFPAGRPKVAWEVEVGAGYAGVAVSGERVIVFHRFKDREVVTALSTKDGRRLWEKDPSYETTFRPQVGGEDGPLCVPTVAGERVVTFGAQGVLTCVQINDGKVLWTRKTHAEYGANEGYFGAGSTPLVDGGRVYAVVGGKRKNAGVVAFDLESGQEAWKGVADEASYAGPIVVSVGGRRQVLAITRLKCVSLDAETGEVIWEKAFGQRGPTVNAASPVVVDGGMFLTASYGIGAVYSQLGKDTEKEVWQGGEALSSQYTTPVEDGGLLYGIDGRSDVPPADLKCIDPRNGEVKWVERDVGYGTVIKADGKLLLMRTDGELVLVKVNEKRYEELGRARLFEQETRALPALAGGFLYVRDGRTLKCCDLRAAANDK